MAEITFKRIFHPVGQGAFFTEQLLSSQSNEVLFNVVYDCGSKTTGIRPKMEKVIDSMYADNRHIDILFLSHFDDDHINFVKDLRSKNYLDGANVFIPLLFEEKFLSVTTFYLNYQNLIDELRGDNIKIIKVKMDEVDPSGQQYFIEEVPDEIDSGTKLISKTTPLWYWVPFNIKYYERIEEFRDMLKTEDLDLDCLRTDGNYVSKNIKTLKRIYRSLNKDKGDGYGTAINLNSLQMMSYPASPDSCCRYERITVCESYFDDYYKWNIGYMKYKFTEKDKLYPGSCLYTGDTSSNSPYIWKTLMKMIDNYLKARLILFQIPHHGSRYSNDERIVDEDRIYAAFTNFDPDYWQKIYDPNISMQFYLRRKPLILVTNDDIFGFEECWFLNI